MECGITWGHFETMILHFKSAFDFHRHIVHWQSLLKNKSLVTSAISNDCEKLSVEQSQNMINEQFSFRQCNDYTTIALF
jgi:hypothetical protein